MASIPEPTPGLIINYAYLWKSEHEQGRQDPTKDRPACIILQAPVDPVAYPSSDLQGLDPGDVILLPITTQPPDADTRYVELTSDDKKKCGLDPEYPSWVIVSEFNADQWPSPDLRTVPGSNKFEFGMATPGLQKRIAQEFEAAYDANLTKGLSR